MAGPDYLTLLAAAGKTAAGALVGPIEVRTNLNADDPTVIDPFAGGEEEPQQGPSLLMTLLKPEVRVHLPNGEYVWAPNGPPSATYMPLLLAGVGGILFSLVGIGGMVGRFAAPRTLLVVGGAGLAALALVASRAKLEEPRSAAAPGAPGR